LALRQTLIVSEEEGVQSEELAFWVIRSNNQGHFFLEEIRALWKTNPLKIQKVFICQNAKFEEGFTKKKTLGRNFYFGLTFGLITENGYLMKAIWARGGRF